LLGDTNEAKSQFMDTNRLFIAIPVPDAVKEEMERAQTELKHSLSGAEIRWTKRSQFHLTLKFLGEVPVNRIEALIGVAQKACQNFPSLQLCAQGVGAFPKVTSPRVIWIGASDPQNNLESLQAAIEGAVGAFTEEKPEGKFSGHVTLGRVRVLNRSQTEKFAKAAGAMARRSFGEWTAAEVEIIRSVLSPGGSAYTNVAGIRLRSGVES
jgi:2'-5' RNA ligase